MYISFIPLQIVLWHFVISDWMVILHLQLKVIAFASNTQQIAAKGDTERELDAWNPHLSRYDLCSIAPGLRQSVDYFKRTYRELCIASEAVGSSTALKRREQ